MNIRRVLLLAISSFLLMWGSIALLVLLSVAYGLYPGTVVVLMSAVACLLFSALNESGRT